MVPVFTIRVCTAWRPRGCVTGTSAFVSAAAKSNSLWFSVLSFIGERSLPGFLCRLVGVRALIPREITPPLVLVSDPFPCGTFPQEWLPIMPVGALPASAATSAVQSCACPASYDMAGATVQFFDGSTALDAHPGV